MSSPPPHQPTNPLKRPSLSSSASQPLGSNPKRPRMHPLRQTSFPATVDTDRAFSDAGSVTGSFTGSLGGTSADGVFLGAARKGKRGRKSKAEKERERERELREEAGSVRGGEARVGSVDGDAMSVKGGGGGRGEAAGEDADEEDDFEYEGELLGGEEEGVKDTEAEKKNLALLVDAFNPIQSERYDLFKRAKLRKETLRRIVNHALSQSVPASVVTTINGFTKVFAGEIIEKARTVQAEWAIAHDQAARAAFDAEEAAAEARAAEAAARATATAGTPVTGAGTPVPGSQGLQHSQPQSFVKQEPSDSNRSTPVPPSSASPMPGPYPPSQQQQQQQQQKPPPRPKREFKPPPNPHRGQLLPCHLREALRRYKRDSEGGGVGFSGLSMGNLGVRGSVTWSAGSTGGRRIFRSHAHFIPREDKSTHTHTHTHPHPHRSTNLLPLSQSPSPSPTTEVLIHVHEHNPHDVDGRQQKQDLDDHLGEEEEAGGCEDGSFRLNGSWGWSCSWGWGFEGDEGCDGGVHGC
ncbi:transcription initiation factor TFIID subunit 11 family protein [Aspergillus clavatus NRRL 1]|uniref:Transcription initiation factor TFIID subunit beta, putative n=1 Tax=Aspergillus clavatus (strain ATCC 1007 / CBS 513.65 / DSM 816 / NCTC 3887 / NRRL 1 / QM 1276 / 107) TaxID=344612 RepID=A1C4X3_ASPCL|nr:transcription initiation factor TFIID subunit beta, putative [Aspergillus clavatus NRRL 1]EAW14741.1 transcription initiation factor TFIID subunit beta, putative [Aspergillus clavatus NRRL 1]